MRIRKELIVWIGSGLIFLAGIYPPWTHAHRSYDWLFTRPIGTAQVDMVRLLIEWTMIVALVTAGYFAPPRKHSRRWLTVLVYTAEPNEHLPFWIETTDGSFGEFGTLEFAEEFLRDYPDEIASQNSKK